MRAPGLRPGGFWTFYYRLVFRARGIRYGRGLKVHGPLLLRLDGDPRNITIGENVTLLPYVDLKIRENGSIHLGDGVFLETMSRLVAANDAHIELGENSQVGIGSVINAGENITIGRSVAVAGYCSLIASEHRYEERDKPIKQQGYTRAPIVIEDDVWLAAYVLVRPGCTIGQGSVIGAQSVVHKDIPPYSIAVGNPAQVIKSR